MRQHNRGHKEGKNGKMVVRPYRYAVKYPCKVRYTSKAFKVFQDYMNWRYGNGSPFSMFGYAMSDHLYEASNRSGFVRRFLGEETRQKVEPTAEMLAHQAARQAEKEMMERKWASWKAEQKPYSRRLQYDIPQGWKTWEQENGLPSIYGNYTFTRFNAHKMHPIVAAAKLIEERAGY